jgi:hypothetical protein
VAREREARDEERRAGEREPAEVRPVEDPRDHEQRGDDGEPDRHHEEGDAEPRLLRERREISEQQVGDRKLERIRRAEDEHGNPDVDYGERGNRGHEVEASLQPLGHGPTKDEQPDREGSDHERQRREEEPACDVVLPRCRARADGLRRRRGLHPDSEGEDAYRRVAVGAGDAPADGVRLPSTEPRHWDAHDAPVLVDMRAA